MNRAHLQPIACCVILFGDGIWLVVNIIDINYDCQYLFATDLTVNIILSDAVSYSFC